MMMMADLQTSAVTKMAHAGFVVVISSRRVKTMDEDQVDRRGLVFLVEKEEGILRKLLKG
jgi:hypothetical protein